MSEQHDAIGAFGEEKEQIWLAYRIVLAASQTHRARVLGFWLAD